MHTGSLFPARGPAGAWTRPHAPSTRHMWTPRLPHTPSMPHTRAPCFGTQSQARPSPVPATTPSGTSSSVGRGTGRWPQTWCLSHGPSLSPAQARLWGTPPPTARHHLPTVPSLCQAHSQPPGPICTHWFKDPSPGMPSLVSLLFPLKTPIPHAWPQVQCLGALALPRAW